MMDAHDPKANKHGCQAKYKQAREERKMLLTPAHQYMIDILADRLSLEPTAVEEFILDSSSLAAFDDFFAKGGCKTISFVYQESEVPGIECGRSYPGTVKGGKLLRMFLANMSQTCLTGVCCTFTRIRLDIPVNSENIHEEIFFSMVDARNGLLKGARNAYNFLLPALDAAQNWGVLEKSRHGEKFKKNFKYTIKHCLSSLDDIQMSNESIVHLNTAVDIDFSQLASLEDMKVAAANFDMVHRLEEVLKQWYKQIEQVLIESDQLRKGVDSAGPLSELEHWKKMSLRFNSIITHIKGPECKAVVMVLHISNSKIMKMWRELDARITDRANEAKDNVKFLNTLEKVCQPLYSSDPVTMMKSVQNVINAIQMIYSVSLYYNTSEKISALFVKVTNQMVTACRSYITDNGTSLIWDQDAEDIIRKMQDCISLYQEYQSRFHKTKAQTMERPGKRPLDISEMQIFCKFEGFCKQLDKITQIITVFKTFESLGKSNIEGIEILARQFHTISMNLKRKQYDMLAPRTAEFETDFTKFMSQISNIENQLRAFMSSCFANIISSQQALCLIQRFQRLNIPCLDTEIPNLFGLILKQYASELEFVKKLYDNQRDDPPLARNMPPVAGRIGWVRHLYKKIEEPISYIKINNPEGQEVVKMYNQTAAALVEFESVYHAAWMGEVSKLDYVLNITLLVRHPKTGKLVVNFDPKVTEVIREAKCLLKMGLEVPKQALRLVNLESKIKGYHLRLQTILDDYESTCENIPADFTSLMASKIKNVESVLRHGSVLLTWSSFLLDKFFQNVDTALFELKLLVKKVQDICKIHIDDVLKDISETMLIELPEDASSLQHLIYLNENQCKEWAKKLDYECFHVKQAVKELEKLFRDIYDSKGTKKTVEELVSGRKSVTFSGESQKPPNENEGINLEGPDRDKAIKFEKEFKKLYEYFSARVLDALVKTTKLSLETVKRRICGTNPTSKSKTVSLIKSEVQLVRPNVVMIPTEDESQQAINQLIDLVLDVSKGIAWSWEYSHDSTKIKDGEKENLHNRVVEHKDVKKVVVILKSEGSSLRGQAADVLQQFEPFRVLWKEDRNRKVKEFMDSNPSLIQIKSEIQRYDSIEEEIDDIKSIILMGFTELSTEPLKKSLTLETKTWKKRLCKYLKEEYKKKMIDTSIHTNKYLTKLSHPVANLEDVRHAMGALSKLRDAEIQTDMTLISIEEAYEILTKYETEVTKREAEGVYNMRHFFTKLQSKARSVQDELVRMQPKFRQNLLECVAIFQNDVDTFMRKYDLEGPMVDGIAPQEASRRLQICQARFEELWRNFNTYTSGEQLLGLPITEYDCLQKKKKELDLLQKLYGLYDAVMNKIRGYYGILWTDVDIEKINAELLEFQNRCRKLPKGLKDWQAFLDLKKTIDDFSESCPLLEMMANKSMMRRHWDRITDLTGHQFEVESKVFTLQNIMEAPLLKYKDDIEDICISAVKEKDIEAKLSQVKEVWSSQTLSLMTFKDRGELMLKGADAAEILTILEDSLMVLGSLMSNRYSTFYKAEIQDWVFKLSTSSDVIEQWIIVQNLWIYLEAVFVGGDIAKDLPQEAKRFQNIDKSWITLMQRAQKVPNVVECCVGDPTLGELLPDLQKQLEFCQKSLAGYLEKKRLLFPRFFFVSDPALLEILGQASDSHTIQSHLLGVFDNVNEVKFHATEYDKILAVISQEGEKLPLDSPVVAQGAVELWLGELLLQQQASLHSVIKASDLEINDEDFDLLSFLNKFQAQVGLLGIQMLWTKNSEEALQHAEDDKEIMPLTKKKFLNLLNTLIKQTTCDLSKFDRVKYETLVTIHVHQSDIFNDLVKKRIKSISDFEWLKQSRFYFKEDLDKVIVSITNVDFIYQNEFLGCTDRLVITPLTDRCYITLSQALGMSMGGAPAGPAGTGKTETTKDMGRCLGKYVVVFNCSDQMDFRGLGRIYKGLAQSGSWGCFDEFNRINLPVLSVAAQQIYIVLMARKKHKSTFIFTDGDCVDLNPEFGLFITMNPGYAGRQELPENLKVQFRTVSMMVPDRQIIMRVKLASCGFNDNVILAQKFFVLYKLCEEQLTKQVHYDFGLRNILSVLRTLGASKRARPDDTESSTVMRVLRDMNLSKLVDEDEPLFLSLINDLFPGIQLDGSTYVELQTAVANQVELAGIVNHPPWNLKLVQLYEASQVRHGLMTLGPSGAGKTAVINILMRALSECGTPHREMRMNPKAITAPQMFGRLDAATNDWTDGIFSTLWRRTLKAKKGEFIWIVLDGPVDAIWIENLNSVLDDNKTLTLANGDRITMSPSCKLVFEVHNMDNASPATVSRVGMVFMSSSALSWKPILQGWAHKRNAKEAESIMSLYDKIFEDAYLYMKQNLKPKMELLECNYIMQSLNLLEGLIPTKETGGLACSKHLERLFVFCLMWSVGAILELEDRDKLEAYIRGHNSCIDVPQIQTGETMYEYMVNLNGEWCHWNNHVGEYVYPTDHVPDYASILVPNVDNTRTSFLLETIAKQYKAVLLIGEQGTAKTVMIKSYTKKYDPETDVSKSLNFSSATEPMMFQRTVESYIEKRIGSTYGPPGGRRMTVFIDDINMPIVNEWGDQITNEIVRQMMEMSGMYNLDKPGDFTTIVDVQILAAMIHPGGGRNDIPQRLKRQFTVFNCTLPSNTSIDKIFGIIGFGYFQQCREFNSEISDMVRCLVSAGRILWQWTKVKMLPTPSKFHYIFNLRDLSRIWQGMLNIKSEECNDIPTLLALFKSECTRVIADRFICSEDREWFEKAVCRVIQEHVDPSLVSNLHPEPYFVDFLRDAPEPTGEEDDDTCFDAPKIYELVPNFEVLSEKLMMYQAQHNEITRGSSLDLVFFTDAMTHLVKISRIIRTDNGNALLVGVGGSGKQSLTRLASYIAGYSIFQITLTRTYNITNFMDDLKLLYKIAGAKGKGITFIFTDNEIKEEAFLEYLNNVLSSGEVSNLFAKDEMLEITQNLISVMKKEFPRVPPTFDNLYDYFISRSRKNLHLVLCFSPVGQKFRSRSLKFPGLISGCTMDWFTPWPNEALVAVSNYFLSEFPMVCSADVKASVVTTMGTYHDKVSDTCESYFERFRRRTHVTPKSYLSFINSYKTLYTEKYNNIHTLAERMNVGLAKLMEASTSVAQLSRDLEVKEKELAIASVKAEKVVAEVTVSAEAATIVKNEVQVVKDKAKKIVEGIEKEKAIAEEKLEAARPALEEAKAALNTIKPADIATVRKLAKPPHLIMRITDCCMILFQKKLDTVSIDPERHCLKPSWGESLKLIGSTGFMTSLQQFQNDKINEEAVELLQPYFDMEDYTMENAKKVCGNVAGLLAWTRAMAAFFAINKEVLPLKANLAIQEIRLRVANNELGKAEAQLAEKQAEFDKVKAKCDAAMKEKQDLLDDAEMCRNKMQAASALIDGLSGEKIRWIEQSKEFKSQINRLVGDVLQLTGFLSYCGPFNQSFREMLLKDIWEAELRRHKIPFTENLNLISALVDPPTISDWNLQGLPGDDLSVQNGIIVTKATRYPLLIDPQTQGKAWIKRKEKNNALQVTSLNHKFFRSHLEDCLSLGCPLLIEDVCEELDPALDNVLEKNFIKSGTSLKVKVGDKEINVMDGFQLYITTKLPNPAYTPEVSAKTSIIDFTVNMKGLENQLLGRVILREKYELEAERLKLIEDVTANKRKMQELEDNLLYKLSSTKGSLVDDDSMIGILSTTKQTAAEVSAKLSIAADAELKINIAQAEYRPVASRGSILYFLITEMSMVNVMYQTSLGQFLKLFDLSLARSKKSSKTQKRIANIIEYLTYEVFRYTVRGLYENHKFIFTLLLALKIDLQNNKIDRNKFQILIKGGAALDLKTCPPKPFSWILDMVWLHLVELSKLPQFTNIITQVSQNGKSWKAWVNLDAPEEGVIPDVYNSLDVFHKLLLIRSWCPDRTLSQAIKYVGDSMDMRFAEPVILDLHSTWEESDPCTPLICFLSMGSDPTDQIEALAKKLQLECRAISMGQGQEVHARKLVQTSMAKGGWVLLQNCHLGLEFMDELLETITTAETMHDTFRVWITTEPHNQFSITLLQSSIKFTNDPPQGVRAGLKRTFAGISQNQLEVSNLPMWKPLLYSVAFLHTAVQERRKFGPLGWNIPYEFNSADFTASVEFVERHLDDCGPKKDVSWVTVRYMLAEVQYGGRVTDDYDKRLLKCFARVWFSKKMFDPSFCFYVGYKIPVCKTVEEYMEYIQSLPVVDSPQALGLHPNADITYQTNTSAEVLDTITDIQPKESGGGSGATRESIVYNMAGDMLEKLPPNYVPHEVKTRLLKMGALNPMNIFLRQEVDRMQKIISAVRSSLTDLKLAIDGTIIMSENLRDALDNIFDARVPNLWRKISWESSTLGFWFTELLERNKQFHSWVFEGRPKTFWMTGFFNPQGFLTAMRQEVTRANKGWALDTVTLTNKVLKQAKEEITALPTEGVYVYGLYLDGASWDRKNTNLIESAPKVLFTPLPVIHMFAINSTAPVDPKLYLCPIYKKPRRTDLNYITAVVLPTIEPPDHWILRGVALLCDIT
ncbi:dynein axonemal heavy chain 8-like isoform X1 [Micropterus dolomieu]|uniref:dynein axonemal heavy chain 8-like isoform X1 n=1 Tax=Micropterus dolomieu TaxID=147949 RepID=UPI001E8D9D29|nr:dynein axonemal heavy chain 8-like isoform X1 [Micropterus dolomieu]XP_045906998.1 dynein axonemal heavy chain 8-like isoform X1 [Micropterus dolomieu]XP_045906999.1 dynein axonemal heavy chain 8-like isoform X1 [Micropterus dolomieu]